jgi:outer membrane protein assembly factor BamB
MTPWIFLSLACTALLISCDKAKEPLTGPREEVFEEVFAPKSEMSRTITLSQPKALKSWPMAGGNAYHQMPPLALNETATEMWRTSLSQGSGRNARLIHSPVIGEGLVFAIDAEGEVTAIKLDTGKVRWVMATAPESGVSQAFGGGLTYDNGVVFVTTASAEVLAFKAQTGELLWRKAVAAPVRSAPTVAEGKLYVTTINNQLEVLDCSTGNILWTHSGIMETAGILGGSSVAVKDGIVLVPYSSGEIFALNQDLGSPLWSDSLAALKAVDSVSALAHIKARPIICEGKALVISHSGRMNLHDLRSGSVIWSRDIGGIRSPALSDGTLFMVTNDNVLLALDYHTGKILWSKQLPSTLNPEDKNKRILWSGPLLINQHLVLGSSQGQIIFCSAQNGSVEKTIETRSPLLLSPISADNTLIWLTDEGDVIAYR